MKVQKRILAAVVCLCLILGGMSVISMAANPTGSITVENQTGTNASVGGKTLNLFKIFNATSSGENISYQWIEENGKNKYEDFFFGTNGVIGEEVGTIHDVVDYINGLKTDSFAFSQMAAKLYDYIHANNISADKTSGEIASEATSYKFDGLDLGYYLIYDATTISAGTPAVRSAAMLAHPSENKVIKLKADRPHVEKMVNDGTESDPDWKLGTTASIGDTVTFKIATMIPDHDLYGNNYKFEITDVMEDELELDENSFNVVVEQPSSANNVNAQYVIYTKNGANKLTNDEVAAGVDFKVVFSNITELAKDTVVEITYDAKVTTDADFQNTNTATLTYSNDPNKADLTGNVDATASVMLWQFTLTKYLEDASGNASSIRLPGAEFQIYRANDLQNPLTFTEGTYTDKNGKTYTKYIFNPEGTVTTLATVNEGDDGKTDVGYSDGGSVGQILVWGLGEGEYVIRETKAPDGYQIAKGDFKFVLADSIGPAGLIANATITETRTETPGQFTRVAVREDLQKYYIGITNAPGSALPETGGMGTTLFTIIGIVLMAGAAAFFTLRKRNSFV